MLQLLEARKWEIHEILYVGEHHAVFLASAVGSLSTMHFNVTSEHRQILRYKALNKLAQDYQKKLSVDVPKGKGISGSTTNSMSARQGWLRQVVPKQSPKPEASTGQKRNAQNPTGESPQPKKPTDLL